MAFCICMTHLLLPVAIETWYKMSNEPQRKRHCLSLYTPTTVPVLLTAVKVRTDWLHYSWI